MPDSIYLAMTAAEIRSACTLPEKLAYMACHLSPYSTGLSNLPGSLPENSMLILNDRTPICGHDTDLIAQQLMQLLADHSCTSILLDLQRPDEPESQQLATHLCNELPGKIAVSHLYAKGLSCPVFLPPLPVGQRLSDHIAPWQGRELWLDICCEAANITVTADGSSRSMIPCCDPDSLPFCHNELHCNYRTEVLEDRAIFTLCRATPHLTSLIEEGRALGISCFVGLYQELRTPRE